MVSLTDIAILAGIGVVAADRLGLVEADVILGGVVKDTAGVIAGATVEAVKQTLPTLPKLPSRGPQGGLSGRLGRARTTSKGIKKKFGASSAAKKRSRAIREKTVLGGIDARSRRRIARGGGASLAAKARGRLLDIRVASSGSKLFSGDRIRRL